MLLIIVTPAPGVNLMSSSLIYCLIYEERSDKFHPRFYMRNFQSMNNNPNKVSIDLSALVHNLRQVKNLVGRGTKIMGVVKSEAYGHGLVPVSQRLETEGVDCLGVAQLYEARELRTEGIKVPIMILSGINTRDECREVVEKDLTPVLFDLSVAERLDQESEKQGKRASLTREQDLLLSFTISTS